MYAAPGSVRRRVGARGARFGWGGALAAVLSVPAWGAASGCGEAAPAPLGFDLSMPPTTPPLATDATAGGAWTVSVWTSPAPPRKGTVEILCRFLDGAGAPADGLALQVIPWMPAHGHGGSTAAPVMPRGDGWYLIAPVNLYMSGRWELRTTLQGFPDEDVVPVVEVP